MTQGGSKISELGVYSAIAGPFDPSLSRVSARGLVSRILAETQYYPKLIQILCQNLLRHMRRQAASDSRHKDMPPWTIRDEDVNAVLRNSVIREEIFNTFQITLQLDKRYQLISLIFADKLYDRKGRHDNRIGFSVQELMDEAFRFWPNGFPASNKREVFHALLDELVGLGILIEDASSGRYQLTSPIIGSMIGTAEEVEHRLLAFETESLPQEIEPERRRMPIHAHEAWPSLSPLVPAQVKKLLAPRADKTDSRIAIVFGTSAMRVDRIAEALQQSARTDANNPVIQKAGIQTERITFLRDIIGIRNDPKLSLIVPVETPWDSTWIREIAELKRRNRFIFAGDASHAWRVCVEEAGSLALGKVIQVETLAPLSVKEVEDQLRRNMSSIDSPRALAERFYRITGGYLSPVATLLNSDVEHALERFDRGNLQASDFGIPIVPAARKALGALITYVSPDEEIRIADLQSIEADTGVDGRLLAEWLQSIGLAEPSAWSEKNHNDSSTLLLNPILRHHSVLRDLGLSN